MCISLMNDRTTHLARLWQLRCDDVALDDVGRRLRWWRNWRLLFSTEDNSTFCSHGVAKDRAESFSDPKLQETRMNRKTRLILHWCWYGVCWRLVTLLETGSKFGKGNLGLQEFGNWNWSVERMTSGMTQTAQPAAMLEEPPTYCSSWCAYALVFPLVSEFLM